MDSSEHNSHSSCSHGPHCLVGVVRHKTGKSINRQLQIWTENRKAEYRVLYLGMKEEAYVESGLRRFTEERKYLNRERSQLCKEPKIELSVWDNHTV